MSFFGKITDFFSGGLVKEVTGLVKDYFPPDMSPEKKANMELALGKLALDKQRELNSAIADAEKSINERIAQQEGTANDLKSLPVVGRIVIFARGCQRPIWGFATMYADLMWFSGEWAGMTEKQESALFVINFLVLGFLFGERAVKNVMPVVSQYIGKK